MPSAASNGMLRHASGRLPVVHGDACKLPFPDDRLVDRPRHPGQVGAFHLPVAELVNMILDAGFTLDRMTEGGEPTPIVLSARWSSSGIAQ
jgi:hypothetical protein